MNYYPEEPAIYPKEPAIYPEEPAIYPEEPAIDPGEPAIDPGEPAIDPGEPAIYPEEPAIDPGESAIDPEESAIDQKIKAKRMNFSKFINYILSSNNLLQRIEQIVTTANDMDDMVGFIYGGRAWHYNVNKYGISEILTPDEAISVIPGNIDMMLYSNNPEFESSKIYGTLITEFNEIYSGIKEIFETMTFVGTDIHMSEYFKIEPHFDIKKK